MNIYKTRQLTFVLKNVERCNIACKYCYFFFGGDESYKKHPPYIGKETIKNIGKFIKQGCLDLGDIHQVNIGFHGGEPLLQKVHDFSEMCEELIDLITPVSRLSFNVQTNGMLINEKWIDAFYNYKVSVGISLDGPQFINDNDRIDKLGRGTYDKVIRGMQLLQSSEKFKQGGISLLTVINPKYKAEQIYNHFIHELGVYYCDFLLPDYNHDAPPPMPASAYGEWLVDLFKLYTQENNPNIKIRILNNTINVFLGHKSSVYGHGSNDQEQYPLITISSNGDLSPVDELRVCHSMRNLHYDISNITLHNLLKTKEFLIVQQATSKYPQACSYCCWREVCGGGTLVSRYSKQQSFNNKSVYCNGLKDFYSEITYYLLMKGYTKNSLLKILKIA